MPYVNIPSVQTTFEDGNLQIPVSVSGKKVLILGTAGRGRTDASYQVTQASVALREFGNEGTLTRSMYEALAQGARNVYLRRLPTGTPAILSNICRLDTSVEGITITSLQEDDDAGDMLSIWYQASTSRLAIYNEDTESWIYDTESILAIDTGLVSVQGTVQSNGVDIGSEETPVPMSGVIEALGEQNAANANITFTPGTDGTAPSRMELFEALVETFQGLDFEDADFLVVPPEASLDCPNVVDGDGINAVFLSGYPTAGTPEDVLGKVFVEIVNYRPYFWWEMRADATGTAQIYPPSSALSEASSTEDSNGNEIGAENFHEANFAWLIAKFCHRASTSWSPIIATIGVEPPAGYSTAQLAQWIGELPTYTISSTGIETVESGDNGEGLLGNKFLAGAYGYNSSLKGGGFFDNESNFYADLDPALDSSGAKIDIGKFLVINHAHVIHTNAWIDPNSPTGLARNYVGNICASLAGKLSMQDANIEPSGVNAVLSGINTRTMKFPSSALDDLLGIRMNGVRNSSTLGPIVCGVKTASRPDSDYTKISTVRCVAEHIKAVIDLGTFIQGRPNTDLVRIGFKSQIETRFRALRDAGFSNGSSVSLSASELDRRAGILRVNVSIVPPFSIEMIQVTVEVSAE